MAPDRISHAEFRQALDELRNVIAELVHDEKGRQVRIETVDDCERELTAENSRKRLVQRLWNGVIWTTTVEEANQGGEQVGEALVALRPHVHPWFEARRPTRHDRPLDLDGPRPRRTRKPVAEPAPAPEPAPSSLWRPGIDREMVMGDVKGEIDRAMAAHFERVDALPSAALRRMLAPFDDFWLSEYEPDDYVWDLTADQMREVIEHSDRAIARLAAIRRAAVAVPDGPSRMPEALDG